MLGLASGLRLRFDTAMHRHAFLGLLALVPLSASFAEEPSAPFTLPHYELLPLPDSQVAFLHDGVEQTRWHFDAKYPRPFFYPFNGPSGTSLTRMGHPGAPDHDHHRSIWFANAKIDGIDFWSDNTKARIRQKHWQTYTDGDKEAIMTSQLGWFDESGTERLEQDLVAASFADEEGGAFLEFQITLRPAKGREKVDLDKNNFGFLAVRVAKSLSHRFGGGQLENSDGLKGEPAIFGKSAAWMDYSGPIATGTEAEHHAVVEGITFYDHPENPRYPTPWHVRSDGWMGAALCLNEGHTISEGSPLVLRYLLHAHSGGCDHDRATRIADLFSKRPGFGEKGLRVER